jgi:hypothetical protein
VTKENTISAVDVSKIISAVETNRGLEKSYLLELS